MLGAAVGAVAVDPTGSSEYRELASAYEQLETAQSELGGQLATAESERDEARQEYEDAVAGADEREAGLDDREAELDAREGELDGRSAELDQRSADLDARSTELDTREEGITQLESYVEENSFGAGTLLVGDQVAAGTYAAPGGGNCYWERLSGTGGDLGDIIANDWSPDGSQVVVTIAASDEAFSSSDCGTWTLLP